MEFTNLAYLESGNKIQQSAFKTLSKLDLFVKLNNFQPLLTGTIPININIQDSDLDIACYYQSKQDFIESLEQFSSMDEYELLEKEIRARETVICRFYYDNFQFEIFGQNRPSNEQEAFRHMIIEHQILEAKGEDFRKQIIKLKKNGYKTEPAFAKLLGLEVDPYDALLNYKL